MEWKEEEECGDRGPRHHHHREEQRRGDDGDDDNNDYEEYASAWRQGVLRYLGRQRSRDAGGNASGVGGALLHSDKEKDKQQTGDADDARGGEDADHKGIVLRRATLPQALMHLPHRRSLYDDPVITALSQGN